MKIIIIGAGFTGIQLARRLISEKNNVVIVENDEETARQVSGRLDCMVLNADGNSLQTLEDAGIAKADALVALADSDEVNMITCSLADAVYPKCLKIARVRNYDYYLNTKKIHSQHAESFAGERRPLYGIDVMVHPDVEAAEAIINAVEHGAATDVLAFDGSDYVMSRVTVDAGSRLDGTKVMDVRKITDKPCLIAYIESGGAASLPTGATTLKAEDVLGLLTLPEHISHFLELCGSKMQRINKIALLGAGRIGTIVAEKLLAEKKTNLLFKLLRAHPIFKQRHFVIVDKDEERVKAAAERFPSVPVFRGDITDEAFLEEEGIAGYDLVICVTRNHELNIVVAGYLKSLGVRKTVSLVSSAEFAGIARKIGSDVAVPLKDAVVDTILGRLRGKGITGLHTVSSGKLEIIEYEVPANAPAAGKAVKDVALPGAFLLLLARKAGSDKALIPTGDTILEGGDRLILATYAEGYERVLARLGGAGKRDGKE
jgi:trk system potassium uptake protein TrkA